ncbi:MAG: trimethylamine methyltransferase family protein [Actinobacteria bacterium]|nr:trimethylamine methyltransferase family protein [Actinomycetota bacterium]
MNEDKSVLRIHETSLRILREIGIRFNEPKALNILGEAGFDADMKSGIVKFDSDVLQNIISSSPSEFSVIAAADSKIDFKYKSNTPLFRTATGSIKIMDFGANKRRDMNIVDFDNALKVCGGLKNLDFLGAMVYPAISDPRVRDIFVFKELLKKYNGHFLAQPYTELNLQYMIDMELLATNGKSTSEHIFSVVVASTTPLKYSPNEIKIMIECSNHSIPLFIISNPIMGINSPVTLAGSLALQHAETMAGVALAQATSAGAPVVYTPRPFTANMYSGAGLQGSPEFVIASKYSKLLADIIKLPVDIIGLTTDSKTTDEQCAIEKTMSCLEIMESSPSIISGLGALEANNSLSLEQLVIDDLIVGIVKRIRQSVGVSDETLAFDIIKKLSFKADYLSERHTIEHLKGEHMISDLLERNFGESWEMLGSPDIVRIAHDKVLTACGDSLIPVLNENMINELESIFLKSCNTILT